MPYAAEPKYTGKTFYALFNLTLYTAVDKPNAYTKAVSKGQVLGVYTGRYWKEDLRKNGRVWWELTASDGFTWFVRGDQTTPVKPTGIQQAAAQRPTTRPRSVTRTTRPPRYSQARTATTGDGASALQAIIANDKKTHLWLVQALYYQAKATAAQVSSPDTDEMAKQLQALIASYNARQRKIKNSTYVNVSTGVSDTVKGWITRLKGLVGMSGIGILPALPVVPILIGAAVSAALLGGLWLLLHDDVPRSANDLKQAAQLTETYKGMSPEEKELFDKTTDESAKAGADSVDDSFFGKLKNNALLIGGAILVFSYLSKNKK